MLKKKHVIFCLRFSVFLIAFAIAFFLILFVADINPGRDLRTVFIKVGVLATLCSLFYTTMFRSGQRIID